MTKNLSVEELSSIVFAPQTAARRAIDWTERKQAEANRPGGGFAFGIPAVDSVVYPFRSAELISLLGYASNLKSTMMDWITGQALDAIAREEADSGDPSEDVIVKVTWEQSVEEDTLSWVSANSGLSVSMLMRGQLGESEFKTLRASAVRRGVTPLWIVGHSELDSRETRRARPRMTINDVWNALDYIASGKATSKPWKFRLIVLDYLQRIRPGDDSPRFRREQMIDAVDRAKDLSISWGCPVLLGVQAGRQVLENEWHVPDINDGQETSNIEQSSDRVFSVTYPIKSYDAGEMIDIFDPPIPVSQNIAILRVLKQKFGASGYSQTFPIWVEPERRFLMDYRNIYKDGRPK